MRINHFYSSTFLSTAVMCLLLSACDTPKSAQEAGADIDSVMTDTENRLSVAGEKMKEGRDEMRVQLSDSAITTKVKAALLADSMIASLNIQVTTLDGVVTLTGDVSTLEISEKVSEIAKAVSEVKQVSNTLTIKA